MVKPPIWNYKEIELLRTLYDYGFSHEKISEEFKRKSKHDKYIHSRSSPAISQKLHQIGLKGNNFCEAQKKLIAMSKVIKEES